MKPPTPTTATLDSFLRDAARKGEETAAWARLVFCGLALTNMFVTAHAASRLAALDPKTWVQVGLLAGAQLASVWFLRAARRPVVPAWFLEASVIGDAIVALGVVGASVLWPSLTYRGFTTIPHSAALPFVLIAAGFRLSGRTVAVAAALDLGSALALLAYDLTVNGTLATTPIDDIGTYLVINVVALFTAIAIVRRTRRLVTDGAQAALSAERARQRLGVYVSREIAEAALAVDELAMGGERRTVAVLFSDLRDFTRYGESLPPEHLVRELNAYLDAMITVVHEEGGIVDKYIGDAIMVVFGIPAARPDDARRAIRTAWRMQSALAAHNAERATQGLPPLRQGIGVHYGEVIAGNIGTPDRLQYTVIGDTVNIASRVEAATKNSGCNIYVSAAAVEAAAGIEAELPIQPAVTLEIRGHSQPLPVYRVG